VRREPPIYVLDANVFIEAARRYYAFDLVPRFWTGLEQLAREGRVGSVDRVRQELERGRDKLAEWATSAFAQGFASTSSGEVVAEFRRVMAWVVRQAQFTDAAKREFADGADGWLIAYAKVGGHVVVTREQPSRDVRRRVPIPNVCDAVGVPYLDTFEMLRQLGVRLA
jgi:predicted nucleic acid-binding protein